MSRYALEHLSDSTLLRGLAALVARDRATTAALLAHLAEVDARRLHLPAGYPSMHAYCVGELRMSEDAAFLRIRAARTAHQFPALFAALADGRLHLSAVILLAPHLTAENVEGLLSAATHRSKAEIERLLAERFPHSGLLAWGVGTPAAAPGPAEPRAPGHEPPLVPERVGVAPRLAPERVEAPVPAGDRPRLNPLGPGAFAVQFTLSQQGHDRLCYAQALLGHQVPSGDLARVFERALEALVRELEKKKFAATARPRPRRARHGHGDLGPDPRRGDSGRDHGGATAEARPGQASADPRHVPARVKRAVWERDGGRCTFVSQTGQRCPARTRLEYDHVEPVARGGEATVSGIRLLCRPHNQHEAERAFGAEFMRHKRLAAVEVRTAVKARAAARGRPAAGSGSPRRRVAAPELRAHGAVAGAPDPAGAPPAGQPVEEPLAPGRVGGEPRLVPERVESVSCRSITRVAPGRVQNPRHRPEPVDEMDVMPWLRALGFRPDEARRAAARCEAIPDAPLEERVRLALSFLTPPHRRIAASAARA